MACRKNEEYGDRQLQPHYHIILFGCASLQDIQKIWQKGFVKLMHFGIHSIRYIAGYIQQDCPANVIKQSYKRFGLASPFKTQSLGLGKSCAINNAEIFRKKLCLTFNELNKPLPRYYCKLLGITELDYQDIIFQNH